MGGATFIPTYIHTYIHAYIHTTWLPLPTPPHSRTANKTTHAEHQRIQQTNKTTHAEFVFHVLS